MPESNFSRYFASNPNRQEAWGVSCTGIGHAEILPDQPYPPPGHPVDHLFANNDGRVLQALQLVYISDGQGEYTSDPSGTEPVLSGNLIVVLPGIRHRYGPDQKSGWIEDWIELAGPAIDRLTTSGEVSPNHAVLKLSGGAEIAKLYANCRRLALKSPPGDTTAMGLLGLAILSTATTNLARQVLDEDSAARIRHAQKTISEHLHGPFSAEKVADQVGMSYAKFRKLFKETTGVTPKQYHVQIRLRRAQDLLANTDMTLGEIASTLGFDTSFHLSTAFKARIGVSPSLWRNRQLAASTSPQTESQITNR